MNIILLFDDRLKSIVKELQHKEADTATKKESRQAKVEATKLQTRRLGKLQYPCVVSELYTLHNQGNHQMHSCKGHISVIFLKEFKIHRP